jgi:DNA-binding transcriptional ArsR family regulator
MAQSKQEINNAVLNALNHPMRRQILGLMAKANGDGTSPKKLADVMDASVQLVAYHVRLLSDAGVIKLTKTTPARGAVEHFYKRAGNAIDKRAAEVLKTIGEK